MQSDFCVGVHALVYLNHKRCVLASEELADNICTNAARVRKVLARLKAAGLVDAHEGSEGGYLFTRDAAGVTLADVAEALDICFVSTNWHSGDVDKNCLVSSGMSGIMDGILGELDDSCKKLLKNKTIEDIDRQIFDKTRQEDQPHGTV